MIAKVKSIAPIGISAYPIEIEVDVSNGLPQFLVVGLPDTTVKESRERVRAAIKNSDVSFPPDKITINLSPAHLKKEGAFYDLPIALGILASSGYIDQAALDPYAFMGELALDGQLKSVQGAIVVAAYPGAHQGIVVPKGSEEEALLGTHKPVYAFRSLSEVIEFLKEPASPRKPAARRNSSLNGLAYSPHDDFAEVRGQHAAKRALEIAVAGGHNVLMVGSPGAGKSMLAKRIPSILPELRHDDAVTITKIYSVAGLLDVKHPIMNRPPFRAPHHSASLVALTGGGSLAKPGEISLAHTGVLFLDEFPEFRRDSLEALRGPLEDGLIHISRAKMQVTYPANVMLVAAMNPCPCGYLTDRTRSCRCSSSQIQKYQSKISGPLIDRMDLHVEVAPLPVNKLMSDKIEAESSESIRARIVPCRERQFKRFKNDPPKLNASLSPREIKKVAQLGSDEKRLLEQAIKELRLSARAYFKILKVSRTIADLAQSDIIEAEHLAEAIQYRHFDRNWNV